MDAWICWQIKCKHQGCSMSPFPPADAFWSNSSRRLLKTLRSKVKLLMMMSNFPFGHNVSNFIKQLSYLLWKLFRFSSPCFQSRLLPICCMWERVKDKVHQVILEDYCHRFFSPFPRWTQMHNNIPSARQIFKLFFWKFSFH